MWFKNKKTDLKQRKNTFYNFCFHQLKIPYGQLSDNLEDQIYNSDSIDALSLPNDAIPYEELEYIKKINKKNRYGSSRGIRSKPSPPVQVQDSSVVKKNLNDRVNGNRQMPSGSNRPESLWDLELEKEEKEAYRFRRGAADDSQRVNQTNSDVLPAIAGTGILLNSLNKTKSAIDFVFVMNVRESEAFPPLLLKQDIECVEDKMSGYRCKYLFLLLQLASQLWYAARHSIISLSKNLFLKIQIDLS